VVVGVVIIVHTNTRVREFVTTHVGTF
jgi:hypothetical protein